MIKSRLRDKFNLLFIIAVAFIFIIPNGVNAEPKFKDLGKVPWADKEITYLYEQKIVNGTPSGTFGVSNHITRAEAALMIARVVGLNSSNITDKQTFSDVKNDAYYFKEVHAVVEAGYFEGYNNGNFGPNDPLTRAQMAKIIAVTFKLGKENGSYFNDANDSWAIEYINAIAKHGISFGNGKGDFKPNNNISRAEFSVMLARAMNDKFKMDPLPNKDPEKQGKIVLLTYHRILEESNNNSPWQFFRLAQDFENDMKAIKESDISVKSYNEVINELSSGQTIKEPTIIIQFDDGFTSDYEFAYPILRDLRLKATFFITTGRADKGAEPYMPWEQIKEMHDYKDVAEIKLFEIGGHGQTHTSLRRQENEPYEDWLERVQYEIEKPQQVIEKNLFFKTNLFALPFGHGFGQEEITNIGKLLNYSLLRGWNKNDNNFLDIYTDNVVFAPIYNNSKIENVIKMASN